MANEQLAPLWFPHPTLRDYWESGKHRSEGATQPWVQALLYHLVRALGIRHVAELGCYLGSTSAWLALAIEANCAGEPTTGSLTLVDVGNGMVDGVRSRVSAVSTTPLIGFHGRSLEFLPGLYTETRFVYLDDDKADVSAKLALIAQRAPGCLVAIHDAETLGAQLPTNALLLDTAPLFGSEKLALVKV